MASSSTASHNQTELENAFEHPEPYSERRQNQNCLMVIIELLQEWVQSIRNDFERICPLPFRRGESAPAVSRQTLPDQVAPFSASTSTSTSTEPWQIFINHRGPDVKYTLASKIHYTLDGMGFRTFLDVEELEPGDVIQAEIEAAMASASLHIAIFSPSYAESSWCLDELLFMLKTNAKIIPIFYHVEPSDLRWIEQGKGKYADAFSHHRNQGRYAKERLNEWKKALHEISSHSGYRVNNNEDEATVLKNIVNCALKIMKNVPLWVAEHPLGLDELVQGFRSVTTEDRVNITGIIGMGGSGKTTLAKELFNRNFSSFKSCSFISEVRDAASKNALAEKQKKLLSDLRVHHLPFDSVDEGKAVLANRLNYLRVLIVLDDVDHIDQLNALLPNKDNLGFQSMVIVTSRERGVLESWNLSSIYKIPGLGSSNAKKLFCWHAFLQPSPPAEFETLVEEFLKACNGLPLSLKVLGAELYGKKSKDYWKSLLHKILRILPSEIQQRLRVSYDALDEEQKEMFLDVACFLIGELESTAIAVWDGMRCSGLHGLQTLVNKCLVELVYEEYIWGGHFLYGEKLRMHDHLRDMGREIASRHSSNRLWQPQIDDIKKHFKREMPIRGIRPPGTFVAFKEYTQSVGISSSFSNGLEILHVKGNELTENFASLSQHLVWLRWEGFPLKKIPLWLTLRHLSVLEIRGADELEELWEDNVDPPEQLRELIIESNRQLQRLPSSIGRLHYLKKLLFNFDGSSLPEQFCGLQSLEYLWLFAPNLSSLPDGSGNLKSLKSIYLQNCKQLSELPGSFTQLIHLEMLRISGCEILSSLPDGFGNLKSLKSINLRYCKQLSELPGSFTQLIHLEMLEISGSEILSSLPDGLGNLKSLKSLYLDNCKQLSELPGSFTQLIHLEKLKISGSEILSSLPDGFGNLKSLKSLYLGNCKQLSELPGSFTQLIHLQILRISGCEILSSLPDGFGNLKSLKSIHINNCKQLSTLPDSFKQLIHLEMLILSGCAKLKLKLDVLENIKKLAFLGLRGCEEIEDLPHQIVNQESLKVLDLTGCIKLRALPTNIGALVKLEYLTFESPMLKCLQTSLVNLCSLKNIRIIDSIGEMDFDARAEDHKQVSRISISSNCCPDLETFEVEKNLHLMEIETLPVSLKRLSIRNCKVLKNTGCISGLVSLEQLSICDCPQIQGLPSFADLASLKEFEMANCPKVEKIEGLQHSKSLKNLRLPNTCWKEPGIQSLERVERLEELVLECDTISAIKPCIQSMKECPRFLKIQGSVSRVAEPTVNSLVFPDLVVNEVDETSGHLCKGDYLFYLEGKEKNEEERKVVRISVCLDRYMSIGSLPFFRVEVEREKAVVVEGRRERVVEAFSRLLARLE